MLALAGWTLFVWVQRIGNVVTDDGLDTVGRLWRVGVAVGFVAVAAVLAGAVLIGQRRNGVASWVSRLGVGVAAVGSAWWVVRGGQILLGDWELAFKAVHTVLAVIVVGLSVMVWRTRGYDRLRYG